MYFVENGELTYQDDRVLLHIKKSAFMYDTESNLLLKHGELEQVQEYYKTYIRSMYTVGGLLPIQNITENVRLVALPVSNEIVAKFLNEAISCTGAIDEQINRILGGLE